MIVLVLRPPGVGEYCPSTAQACRGFRAVTPTLAYAHCVTHRVQQHTLVSLFNPVEPTGIGLGVEWSAQKDERRGRIESRSGRAKAFDECDRVTCVTDRRSPSVTGRDSLSHYVRRARCLRHIHSTRDGVGRPGYSQRDEASEEEQFCVAGALPRTPCCLSTRFALAVVIVSASKFPGFHTHFGKVHGYMPLIPLFNSSSLRIQLYLFCLRFPASSFIVQSLLHSIRALLLQNTSFCDVLELAVPRVLHTSSKANGLS